MPTPLRQGRKDKRRGLDPTTSDMLEYSAAEVEFMCAMERFQRLRRRRATCRDVLAVARSLGYRKHAA